jgi:hypothetical protein
MPDEVNIVDKTKEPLPPNLSKKELVRLAEAGNEYAKYALTELNLKSILEEAKSPTTREEIAIEMLARLSVSEIEHIRQKAIKLLIKVHPIRFIEVVEELKNKPEVRQTVLSEAIIDDDIPLKMLLNILKDKMLPDPLFNKIVDRIDGIRKVVEENASEIVNLNYTIEEINRNKKKKFKIIERFYKELQESKDDLPLNIKQAQDLKIDIELAYQSLKATIEEEKQQ